MSLPDFLLPAPVARVLGRLPVAPPAWLLCQVLNRLIRRGILPVQHELLHGHRFCIRVSDAGLTLHLRYEGRAFVCGEAREAPDLLLSATLADFSRLLLREEDPDTLFFHRRLRIEGDTELGLVVKNLLDSVDWQGTPLARFMAA